MPLAFDEPRARMSLIKRIQGRIFVVDINGAPSLIILAIPAGLHENDYYLDMKNDKKSPVSCISALGSHAVALWIVKLRFKFK